MFRYVNDEWAKNAAIQAIQRLQETNSLKKDKPIGTFEEQEENQIKYSSDSFPSDSINPSDDSIVSEKNELATGESGTALNTQTTGLNADSITVEGIGEEAFEVRVSLEEGASS